ncbi:MAG: helix-turn-helix domain-containing protein [Anaerolineae bacterium]|nr:helix-turn-helix domain-containing protein [Anaerolineae bacterium]
MFIMLFMLSDQIDPNKMYTTAEVAEFTQLSTMHISRLADAGEFPGSERKAPVPRSPRMIPGTAVIDFLEKRKLNQ